MNILSRAFVVFISLYFCWSSLGVAASAKDKPKTGAGQTVDSGSFGVFRSGTRVATETFSIQQSAEGSVVTSQFKSAQGEQVAEQSSELDLTPSGELRRYEWKETSPEKSVVTVTPNDAFLVQQYGSSPDKTQSQSFLLPASTTILDDFAFVHRELLLWRYLASACKQDQGPLSCPRQKVQFGALNPHARSSLSVAIQFSGREKLKLHGAEDEYSKFLITSEGGDWAFWTDDRLKIVRLVNDAGVEIIRD